MRIGLEAVGGECVYSCERDKFARETYLKNFQATSEHLFSEDINSVEIKKDIPKHQVLAAGFPCQPFSLAGVSKKNALGNPHGFDCQEQGNLFFKIAEILKTKKPDAYILENVKNLRSHDKGNTFRVIQQVLEEECNYSFDWRVLNAKGWLPQNRERIFIIGFKRKRLKKRFPLSELLVRPSDRGPKLSDKPILHSEDGNEKPELAYTNQNGKVLHKYVLTDHLWEYLQNYAAKHRALGHGFGYGLVTHDDATRTLSARYYKDGSEILIHRGDRKNPRRLTPRECARLMGFHNSFKIPVSDTQAYKQFGNSVAVPVVKTVGAYLLRALEA